MEYSTKGKYISLPHYIDPGTGSMLVSVLIGIMATLFFVFRAVLNKIKFFFTGRKGMEADSSYKPFVIYNEGRQYYDLFHPIVLEFEKRGLPLCYLTSMKDDPTLHDKYDHVKAEYIGDGNRAYARLNILSAGIVVLTTPNLDVFQMKRSRNVKHYSHLPHSLGMEYCLFGLDYFDSVLVSGTVQEPEIRMLEAKRHLPAKEIVTVGCVYLDELAKKISGLPEEKEKHFTVLLSPTWGVNGLLGKYGAELLDPLAETGWRIIVRPHPQSKKSEPEMLAALQERYRNRKNVEWDFERENIRSMKKSDIMISDYSGIIFDYSFLFGKPVIYANGEVDLRSYDAHDLDVEPWIFSAIRKIGVELKKEDFADIKHVIEGVSESGRLSEARETAGQTAWMYRGLSAVRTVDYLEKKYDEIKADRN